MQSEIYSDRVLIIAGEASGDNYGSRLIKEMMKMPSPKDIWAVGGELMQKEGARLISHYSEISVVGLVEVLGRLPQITGLLKKIKKMMKRGEVRCIVLIDFPDFNFIVGKYAKKLGIPVIYYIPPQLWAWREGRARVLERFSSHVVVPFPFEVDYFKGHDVTVHCYGHPLFEILRDEGIEFQSEAPTQIARGESLRIGLFPGSRNSEVNRMLPLQMGAAAILKERQGDVEFFLPLANSSLRESVERVVGAFPVSVNILGKRDYAFFHTIDLAIASSGTVTLELAIFGVPTVIIYKVSPLTYIIGKMLVKVDRIGLPNIVTGEKMFPELIQGAATPENIAGKIDGFLSDTAAVEKIREKSRELLVTLDGEGPSKKVAELVMREMQ